MNDDRERDLDILKLIRIDRNKVLEEIFNIYYERIYKFFSIGWEIKVMLKT